MSVSNWLEVAVCRRLRTNGEAEVEEADNARKTKKFRILVSRLLHKSTWRRDGGDWEGSSFCSFHQAADEALAVSEQNAYLEQGLMAV